MILILTAWGSSAIRSQGTIYRGRVVSEDGAPVAGAMVNATVFSETDSGGWNTSGTEPGTVRTSADGRFSFRGESRQTTRVLVEAGGFAPGRFEVPAADDAPELRLCRGSKVIGRVLEDGAPVPSVTMQLVIPSVDDSRPGEPRFETWPAPSPQSAITDVEGRFVFEHVQPDEKNYVLFATMESICRMGTLDVPWVVFKDREPIRDAGDLKVRPGLTVAGRLVVAGGGPLPAGARLRLQRCAVGDGIRMPIGEDGRFEFRNLPSDTYRAYLDPKDFRWSSRNRSFDPTHVLRLRGAVTADITDLVLEIEPGDPIMHRIVRRENELGGWDPGAADFRIGGGVPIRPLERPLSGIPAK